MINQNPSLKVLIYFCLIVFLIVPESIQAQNELRIGLPLGHAGWVFNVTFSPDGARIVTVSGDFTTRIWDTETGRLIHTLKGHSNTVRSAVFSLDGKHIVTASADGTARIWETETGRHIRTLEGHTASVMSASFSRDEARIITASGDGTARVWENETGRLMHVLEGHKAMVFRAMFTPDGDRIITASFDNTARIWKTETGLLLHILEGHTGRIYRMSFSPDGTHVVTASTDGTARIWEMETGLLVQVLKGHTGNVYNASFSPDGTRMVTASGDGTAVIWDIKTGRVLHTLEGHKDEVNRAEFSPDGILIITASRDDTARIWENETGRLMHVLEGHTDDLTKVVFSPDGALIVTASRDGTAKIWKTESGRLVNTLGWYAGSIRSVVINPEGSRIITASHDHTARVWDTESGSHLRTLEGHMGRVYNASFSSDGKRIVTASDDSTARIWEAETGRYLRTLMGHTGWVTSAVFSPDGSRIITASTDSSARIWESETGHLVYTLKGHMNSVSSAAFSPDGSRMVTASGDGFARIWDIGTGKLVQVLKGHTGWVRSAVFSPDGSRILTASHDNTAKIWEIETGMLLHTFNGHSGIINSAVFSQDGVHIVTASYDGTARIWVAETGLVLHILEGHMQIVENAVFRPNKNQIITASADGSIILWDTKTGDQLLQHYIFRDGAHATLSPNGLFDATEGAMDLMYWIRGNETIGFEQLKDRFWEPGLWQKVMEGETLREVQGLNNLRMYPDLNMAGVDESGNLPIQLTKRDGGYGRVVVRINGKEIATDARGEGFDPTLEQVSLSVPIAGHPFLLPGEENSIEVLVYEEDNWLHSRTIGVNYVPEPEADRDPPQLYVVSVGVSDYSGTAIDLRYAAKDAEDIATALELAGSGLFGTEKTHTYTLSTNQSPEFQPSRANISRVFEEIGSKATSDDILVVYLAGHGISVGGSLGDFHFLTHEAWSSSAAAYSDPQLRESVTLSSGELTGYINLVPALKQVLILDTCASGQVVEDLIASRDGLDSATIRSLDRMRDRTGMYVLTGSAADAVSYEASSFGQGVLTYSILEAIRGAALRENEFVDISTLFEYSRDRVPQLAEGIGGIQVPQVFSPRGGGSFDIGRVTDEKKALIPLAEIKPVFVRTSLMNTDEFDDTLNLSALVDKQLLETSARGSDAPLIWVDARNHPNACRITGGYTQTGQTIELQLRLRCGEDVDRRFEFTTQSVEETINRVLQAVVNK